MHLLRQVVLHQKDSLFTHVRLNIDNLSVEITIIEKHVQVVLIGIRFQAKSQKKIPLRYHLFDSH